MTEGEDKNDHMLGPLAQGLGHESRHPSAQVRIGLDPLNMSPRCMDFPYDADGRP